MMVGMSVGSYAITNEEENELLLKAIVEGSTSVEQKAITGRYIAMLIDRKQIEANKYRELAQMSSGGKIRYQNLRQKQYLQKAQNLENQIEHYKTLALKYSTSQVADNQ